MHTASNTDPKHSTDNLPLALGGRTAWEGVAENRIV